MYVRVKENESLVKDMSTSAILNTDHAAVLRHKKRMAEIEKAEQIQNEINTLKNEFGEIKQMLRELLSRGING